jgi:hypothetical protein
MTLFYRRTTQGSKMGGRAPRRALMVQMLHARCVVRGERGVGWLEGCAVRRWPCSHAPCPRGGGGVATALANSAARQ